MGIHEEQARDKSDWTDQDLLTVSEARERLVELRMSLVSELAASEDEQVRASIETRLSGVDTVLARHAGTTSEPPPLPEV